MIRIRPKADLVYGASGTRKTTQIGIMALWVLKHHNKKTRLVTADGGGYDPLIALVDTGIIVPWVLIGRKKLTWSTLDLVCQGYWPKDPDDPESPLVAPTLETWQEFGAYGFEGLTSFGDQGMRMLKRDQAKLSQDPSFTYTEEAIEVDGKKRVINYSGGNMAYYGFTQDQLYDLVTKTHLLPVEKVLWSALEGKGEEEGSRAPTYGPAIVGKKSTGKATQWFGNSLHIEQLITRETDQTTKQVNVIEKPVMYTRTHADPQSNIPFPCKTRAVFQFGSEVPMVIDPPDMGKLYDILDSLNQKMKDALASGEIKITAPPTIAPKAPTASQVPAAPIAATPQAVQAPTSSQPKPLSPAPGVPRPAPVPAPAPVLTAPVPVVPAVPAVPAQAAETVSVSSPEPKASATVAVSQGVPQEATFVPPRIAVKKPTNK